MNKSTQDMVREIAELQDRLNCLTNGTDWKKKNLPWIRAIIDEVSEYYNQMGYKWWKKQECKTEQAKLELIDILHFVMSDIIQRHATFNWVDTHWEEAFEGDNSRYEKDPICVGEKVLYYFITGHETRALYELFRGLATFGMTMEDIYKVYIFKNVLNVFRQEHGYKEGTYIKDWNGVEDNCILEDIIKASDTLSDGVNLFDYIYQALEENYEQVVKA